MGVIAATNDFWVFGYGSLMWNPGFEYLDSQPATLKNFIRSFCLYSHFYRGTPDCPGLVLGLNPSKGNECRGIAFKIAPENITRVTAYLNERELCGYAYKPVYLDLALDCSQEITAYTFIADQNHPLYAGDLPKEKAADLIMAAAGRTGLNRDYLINTVRDLEAKGYHDESMHALLKLIEYRTGLLDAGGGI